MLDGLGIETGVDFDRVVQTGEWVVRLLGRPNASKAALASLRRRPQLAAQAAEAAAAKRALRDESPPERPHPLPGVCGEAQAA